MPVTTRLQARRALEAASKSRSPSALSERSPSPSPELNPVSSSSPRPLGSITRSFATVHARRQLSYIRHHFQSNITRSSPSFPNLSQIFVSEPYLPEADDILFLDYVWDDDYDYRFDSPCPTCASVSPAKPPSSDSHLFVSDETDIGNELRGIKRQRSDERPLPDVRSFPDSLSFHTEPTIRKYITPVTRSSSSASLLKPKVEEPQQQTPTAEIVSLRRQRTMQRPQNTYLTLEAHHSGLYVPSPVLELPEMVTKLYSQYMLRPVEPRHPNWLGEHDIHPTWKGSFSPKVRPMGSNYAVEAARKRRKLEQIKADMRIERILNTEPVVPEGRLPGFQELAQMADVTRFDDMQERHDREAVVTYDKPESWMGGGRDRR